MLRVGHLVHGDVGVSPGATASEAPARRPEGDARVILAAALQQQRARTIEPQRGHRHDAPARGGGVGGEAREILGREAQAVEYLVRVRVRARVRWIDR